MPAHINAVVYIGVYVSCPVGILNLPGTIRFWGSCARVYKLVGWCTRQCAMSPEPRNDFRESGGAKPSTVWLQVERAVEEQQRAVEGSHHVVRLQGLPFIP